MTILMIFIQNKAKNNKRILQKQIHFKHFPSLSFGPSQGHNSVNIGTKTTSRTIFGNYRTTAFIWHQD